MRLINADAMLERNKNSIYDTTDLEEMLKYEPTAYDVDKVVEQLVDEITSDVDPDTGEYCNNWVVDMQNEIIRRHIDIIRDGLVKK